MDGPSTPVDSERSSRLAEAVGSAAAQRLVMRVLLGVAVAFLVGAGGYAVGVRTTRPASSAVDVGFLEDMTDHHEQAVRLSLIALSRGSDPVAKGFATEVLLFQRQEMGRFMAYQEARGVASPDFDPQRTTMAWMGMPTPLATMPGMASEAQIASLERATGTAADVEFLTLMQAHHLGGAHMSEYAAAHAADPVIREMAERMARNQRIEVTEYQGLIDKLSAAK